MQHRTLEDQEQNTTVIDIGVFMHNRMYAAGFIPGRWTTAISRDCVLVSYSKRSGRRIKGRRKFLKALRYMKRISDQLTKGGKNGAHED